MSSSTRLLVLGVVKLFQPVHGYVVRRELLSWRAEEWANVAPGSIYNALKSLAKDGLLAEVGTDQVGGRPERTTYRITVEGEKQLEEMVRDTWWTVRQPLDPLMPALSFLWALPRAELVAALKHRIAQIEGMREHSEFSIRSMDATQTPPHVAEMLRLSMARLAGEIDWARALIRRLEAGDYHTADDPPWLPAGAQPPAPAKKRSRRS